MRLRFFFFRLWKEYRNKYVVLYKIDKNILIHYNIFYVK